jgi:hypothetical protein
MVKIDRHGRICLFTNASWIPKLDPEFDSPFLLQSFQRLEEMCRLLPGLLKQ